MESFDVGAGSPRPRSGRGEGTSAGRRGAGTAPLPLRAHLEKNRIAHTYVFTGPEGPEKVQMAQGFAKALNCERRGGVTPPATKGAETAPLQRETSGCCTSCQKIERGTHPDVRWYGRDETARSIKIEEMRALVHEANLKPFEGRWKVFILEGAERLTLEAASALLKTLEEPPEHSVFLLLVENKSHLLETIQSRAFEIRVPPEPERDPRETPAIRVLEEKGWETFFEELRKATRPELEEILVALLLYVRNVCVEELEWRGAPGGRPEGGHKARPSVEALDAIYETLEALDQNANQKLAVTHLEIRLRKAVPGTSNKRTEVPGTALK